MHGKLKIPISCLKLIFLGAQNTEYNQREKSDRILYWQLTKVVVVENKSAITFIVSHYHILNSWTQAKRKRVSSNFYIVNNIFTAYNLWFVKLHYFKILCSHIYFESMFLELHVVNHSRHKKFSILLAKKKILQLLIGLYEYDELWAICSMNRKFK